MSFKRAFFVNYYSKELISCSEARVSKITPEMTIFFVT